MHTSVTLSQQLNIVQQVYAEVAVLTKAAGGLLRFITNG
jgi:hypothetical protein